MTQFFLKLVAIVCLYVRWHGLNEISESYFVNASSVIEFVYWLVATVLALGMFYIIGNTKGGTKVAQRVVDLDSERTLTKTIVIRTMSVIELGMAAICLADWSYSIALVLAWAQNVAVSSAAKDKLSSKVVELPKDLSEKTIGTDNRHNG